MAPSIAWYSNPRQEFAREPTQAIVERMSGAATRDGWYVDRSQHEEWVASIGILKDQLADETTTRVAVLREALADPRLSAITDVILEYNLKRRGLRIDAVLLAPGVLIVIEFKRSKLGAADRDQVLNYCVNLREFHRLTRQACEGQRLAIVPILALTSGEPREGRFTGQETLDAPWESIMADPLVAGPHSLSDAIAGALQRAVGDHRLDARTWVESPFSPSSTILDAAISLFGQHDVSAIEDHAVPVAAIDACVASALGEIRWAKANTQPHVVLLSGTPGSGKTLVGLRIAFSPEHQEDAVFVTGNAPLVEVLTEALKGSYRSKASSNSLRVPTGYAKTNARLLIQNAAFKIVKAHHFLGERGKRVGSTDGSIVVFDEAQRTYEKGRQVLGKALGDHEADLIMASLEETYEAPVVVALLGHNQAINRGERGAVAWFEAAERRGWTVAVSDETLALDELGGCAGWHSSRVRRPLAHGHLSHSMRFYRNARLEHWAHAVLGDDVDRARAHARELAQHGHTVYLTRDLAQAKAWVRSRRVGEERIGMIGSSQGRRLAAEGLFVDQKPKIDKWMIAPTDDIRSSNMLETVQNQYQIQGLELDYTLVAWDADLRRGDVGWEAFKIVGARWARDRALDIAKNGYRVLLTRARKGMVIFVPRGDVSGLDETRDPRFYDGISARLVECGAEMVP